MPPFAALLLLAEASACPEAEPAPAAAEPPPPIALPSPYDPARSLAPLVKGRPC